MHRFFFAPAVLAIACVLPACAAGNAGPGNAIDDDMGWNDPNAPLAASGRTGLSPTCFWNDNTQMSLRIYGALPLVENDALRAPHALPKGCEDVPSYVVRCALPEGESIQTSSGETLEGQFGLAPNWTSEKLSSDEQRLITGCLLQHVSEQKDVPFTLVTALSVVAKGGSASQSESIVSGNLFTGGTSAIGSAAFEAFGCVDTGLVDVCGASAEDALFDRLCGSSAKCGVTSLGACNDVCDFDETGSLVGCFGETSRYLTGMRVDSSAMSTLHDSVCQ